MGERVKVIYIDESRKSSEIEVTMGTSLLELAAELSVESQYQIVAAYVNNQIKELSHKIYKPAKIRYVDITSFAGMRVYQRTITMVMQCAIEEIMPHRRLAVRHSMGANGIYCEVESEDGVVGLVYDEVLAIRDKMREIVMGNDPIHREKLPTEEVYKLYEERGFDDKLALLETRPRLYSELYTLKGTIGYFYGSLAPSTGYVDLFEIEPYSVGFYLGLPLRCKPSQVSVSPRQEKMFEVFKLHRLWVDVMGVPSVGALNEKVLAGDSSEMIKLAETLVERALVNAADMFTAAYAERKCRIILLAGPSSSGKTTTAKRLGVHLQVLGFKPVLISLDDYFVDRELTPRDESGDYDFEALEAIDLERFNANLTALFNGDSVDIPRYDFITGVSRTHEKPLQLSSNSILIVEGIHGLNPNLTPQIDPQQIFRIYAACFTTVGMDSSSRIASADNRLLRRLTRDYATRGSSGQNTLSRWASVRRGEERHIFPYQENADCMINTALFYEIAVLKPYAERILREIPNTGEEFEEAKRMLKFLDQFLIIDPREIPPTSTLCEFIGGGSFSY
ncbi:MAG: nucleoside kinase [Rikenellaceae bacterium]